ncbi:MAG: FAD-dependent oxidoreductase [Patescibacteria group bacterium]
MKNNVEDLIIIGGGIMGLFTAYYASNYSKKIIILEKRTIGNKFAASSGYSRSIRNDYLDPFYSCLAAESQKMWKELEIVTGQKFIIKNGCLNIAKEDVTIKLEETYAQKSYQILKKLGFKTKYFKNKKSLRKIYPQFDADIGCLDVDAGFLYIPDIINGLKSILKDRGVKILENCEVKKISKGKENRIIYTTKNKIFKSKNISISVGVWSLEILDKIDGARWLKLPIIPIEQQLDYFEVPKNKMSSFTYKNMPVFAYLDVGIYGHPLYKKSPGLKIAYFDPMGAKLAKSVFNPEIQNKINNNYDFIRRCFPDIKNIKIVKQEFNYYDMTPDNNFIVDQLPGFKNIFIAGGFCGTGFKFAPIIGKIMAEKILRKSSIYDISRFSAKRFGRINDLSFLKTIPTYLNFFKPRNWKYLKKGIEAILLLKKMP